MLFVSFQIEKLVVPVHCRDRAQRAWWGGRWDSADCYADALYAGTKPFSIPPFAFSGFQRHKRKRTRKTV